MIALEFNHFEVEHEYACGFDSLCVYNGTIWDEKLIACYCGDATGMLVPMNSSYISLVFESDESERKPGFDIAVHYYNRELFNIPLDCSL